MPSEFGVVGEWWDEYAGRYALEDPPEYWDDPDMSARIRDAFFAGAMKASSHVGRARKEIVDSCVGYAARVHGCDDPGKRNTGA